MDAEYSIVDDYAEGEKVEHVRKVLPDGWRAIFALALGVKSIRLVIMCEAVRLASYCYW